MKCRYSYAMPKKVGPSAEKTGSNLFVINIHSFTKRLIQSTADFDI
jgi:hypothetical protein